MPLSPTQKRRSPDGKLPWIRRRDQGRLLVLAASLLLMSVSYWWLHGGHRGELVEINRADPRTAKFLVDINQADWPEWTSLQFIEPLVFQGCELPQVHFDHRVTPGIDAAEKLMLELLADGPMRFGNLLNRVKNAGVSRSTLVRAGKRLGVAKEGGFWCMPVG